MTKATAMSRDKVMVGGCVLKERRRQKNTAPFWKVRLLEIEKVIRARHGKIPETDDVPCNYMFAVAHTAHAAFESHDDQRSFIVEWLRKWAPWAADPEAVAAGLLTKMHPRRRHMTGRAIASSLRVTYAERTALGIRTISAWDKKPAEMKEIAKERKRERDRIRQEEKRRANGVGPRCGHLSEKRPWDDEGISRRTWYRHQAMVRDAISSPPLQSGKPANGTEKSPPLQSEETAVGTDKSPLLNTADFVGGTEKSPIREYRTTGDFLCQREVHSTTLVPNDDDLMTEEGAGLTRAVPIRSAIQLDLFNLEGETR